MKNLLPLIFLFFYTLSSWAADLPNRAYTPGDIDPSVTQQNIQTTICAHEKPSWSKSHRPSSYLTNRIKKEQISLYGYSETDPAYYEEDHLIPITLGGLSYSEPQYKKISGRDAKNLWPEPRETITSWPAEKKDELEYSLWKAVCNSDIGLKEAQDAFAFNWIKSYDKYEALRAKYPSPFKRKSPLKRRSPSQ